MIRKIKNFLFNTNESNWSYKKFNNITESVTIYIGNLSFNVREENIWNFFSRIGEIKRIITGINRIDLSQCGFCFIEFWHPKISTFCFKNLNGIKFFNRFLRIDLDEGFRTGRQFGRGKRGGQILEESKHFVMKKSQLKKFSFDPIKSQL